jgi:hypothetical protein
LNRPGAIPALFTMAGLSLQFFRENAFVATLDDNDKDSLLSGSNIRKKESSVKGKDVKCFFFLISYSKAISFSRSMTFI